MGVNSTTELLKLIQIKHQRNNYSLVTEKGELVGIFNHNFYNLQNIINNISNAYNIKPYKMLDFYLFDEQ
ncbi:hypothetical protein T10_9588 [Trichinella papuae]|uniref:Uncharacterized protein n=1 Tax=Trichinella papuae TaxID=268474 RepID=A0A0V1N1A4_9BILA|nr:hypothetical protein T10_9588 [Trichinella papuae]